ncbi:hypothetical protein R7007_12675 [Vibrio sp. 1636]|uniref:Uncharacterized protein n=1 Tax=Vibrio alginolyticus TaxID=663 RepID=A0A7Y0MWI5_VIBAL|nr:MULTISPECIES: hypothetical protein [Vibrio]MDW2202515.1 hypothetical protein [Vibrio sp. 1636]NMR74471.1 hypothetical protein [Vibrio alginolyticus]
MKLKSLKNYTPESIYLLLFLLRKYGLNGQFTESVDEIVRDSKATRNTVVELFRDLKEGGCVVVEPSWVVKGKGKNVYHFTEKVDELLNSDSCLKAVCESIKPATDSVMNSDSLQSFGGVNLKIRNSNRLFLSILVAHADEFGTVSNLSFSDISKSMGGISRDRFKSQLSTAKKMGVVEYHIAGVTGKRLFGKTKSTFYLNISHPLLELGFCHLGELKIHLKEVFDGTEKTESIALGIVSTCLSRDKTKHYFSKVNKDGIITEFYKWPVEVSCLRPIVNANPNPYEVLSVVGHYRDRVVLEQLQLVLNDLASEMMFRNWIEHSDIIWTTRMRELLSWKKILPTRDRILLKAEHHPIENIDELLLRRHELALSDEAKIYLEIVAWLLALAREIALRFERLLKLIYSEQTWEGGEFWIRPIVHDGYSVRRLHIVLKSTSCQGSCEVRVGKHDEIRIRGQEWKVIEIPNFRDMFRASFMHQFT